MQIWISIFPTKQGIIMVKIKVKKKKRLSCSLIQKRPFNNERIKCLHLLETLNMCLLICTN